MVSPLDSVLMLAKLLRSANCSSAEKTPAPVSRAAFLEGDVVFVVDCNVFHWLLLSSVVGFDGLRIARDGEYRRWGRFSR
jgi:hypothetical protein